MVGYGRYLFCIKFVRLNGWTTRCHDFNAVDTSCPTDHDAQRVVRRVSSSAVSRRVYGIGTRVPAVRRTTRLLPLLLLLLLLYY